MDRISAILLFSFVIISQGFEIRPRILNGVITNSTDFPFYVHLETENKTCGGSLISDSWVITAAHCISPKENVDVYFGVDKFGSFAKAILTPPENQYIHPGYIDDKVGNDIALLKLPYQPKLLPNVQPAKLPTDCRSLQNGNEEVIAIGTGQIEVSKHNPRFILRQVDLTTMPSKKCALKTPELNQRSVIRVDVINGKSIAMGDSGGPLIQAADGTIIGISSLLVLNKAGHEADPSKPYDVVCFSNIRYHFKWISEITGFDLPQCKRSLLDELIFRLPGIASWFNMRRKD